jgi:death-on-curing protein
MYAVFPLSGTTMGDVEYLSYQDVLDIHADQLALYGGLEGIRDENSIRSSMDMPRAGAFGEDFFPTIEDKAAAYLYHFAAAQGFVDGNKRTALVCSVAFLARNGFMLNCSNEEIYDLTMRVANRFMDSRAVADWIRTVIGPIPADYDPSLEA